MVGWWLVVVVLVPSEQPDWEGGRAGVPDPGRPGSSLGPGWGPAPGGCHGDAGSAAPRRGNKAIRRSSPELLLRRRLPPPGRRRRRRRRSPTPATRPPAGQVVSAPAARGWGPEARAEAPGGVGTGASTPPRGAGLRGGCAPAGHGLSAGPPRNPGRRPRARRRAANFAAGAPDGARPVPVRSTECGALG